MTCGMVFISLMFSFLGLKLSIIEVSKEYFFVYFFVFLILIYLIVIQMRENNHLNVICKHRCFRGTSFLFLTHPM